jgi:hypothetical protein
MKRARNYICGVMHAETHYGHEKGRVESSSSMKGWIETSSAGMDAACARETNSTHQRMHIRTCADNAQIAVESAIDRLRCRREPPRRANFLFSLIDAMQRKDKCHSETSKLLHWKCAAIGKLNFHQAGEMLYFLLTRWSREFLSRVQLFRERFRASSSNVYGKTDPTDL